MKSDYEYLQILLERKEYLQQILTQRQKQNSKLKPELQGHIHVQKHRNKYQYYLRNDAKDTTGKYLPRKMDRQVQILLQKEYNDKTIKTLTEELSLLDKYICKADPTKLVHAYQSMSEGRRNMINPVVTDDTSFVKRWTQREYKGKEFYYDTPEFYTDKGERVRSKSEVIIANILNKLGIPYHYEYPLHIDGMGTVYPDFTALNVKKRKEVIIEHLGLLDDQNYREIAISKITKYEMEGITMGDNLLITFESMLHPLNIPLVEKRIKEMLL